MVYVDALEGTVNEAAARGASAETAIVQFHDRIGLTSPADRARRFRQFGMEGGDIVAVKGRG